MTKKKMTAVISLVVGGVILSSAALANFATSNGYGVYKESIRKMFGQENYTFTGEATVSIDGEELIKSSITEQYDKASNAYYKKEYTYDKTYDERPEASYERYVQDGMWITRYTPRIENGVYSYNTAYNVEDMYKHTDNPSMFAKDQFGGDTNSDEMFDKYFNFAGSCIDLFVGDIKNNFVLVGTDNGLATYEANLDLFQIPEVVNSGADLIVSQVKRDVMRRLEHNASQDVDEYIAKLSENPFISSAACTVTVDDEGRLVDNVLVAEVSGKDTSGEAHKMNVKIHITVSDYGTTVPTRVDLDGANVKKASDRSRERVKELEVLLQDTKLDSDEKENYEREKEHLQKQLDYFDEYGSIDGLYNTAVPTGEGSVEATVEEAEYADAEAAPSEAVSMGVIGGADGPTAVYVTK